MHGKTKIKFPGFIACKVFLFTLNLGNSFSFFTRSVQWYRRPSPGWHFIIYQVIYIYTPNYFILYFVCVLGLMEPSTGRYNSRDLYMMYEYTFTLGEWNWFLTINQLDLLISQIYSWNETLHVIGQFLCPPSGVFHCTHTNGICHTGLLTACEQDQHGTGQFLCPSSGVFHCTHSNGICHTGLLTACEQDQDGTSSILILLATCQQTCMTYTIAVCSVKNSWWWIEEQSETCRVSFQ